MTRWPLIVTSLFLMTGCATHRTDHKIEHYETSAANCYEKDKVLDCDWESATDDWLTATNKIFRINYEH